MYTNIHQVVHRIQEQFANETSLNKGRSGTASCYYEPMYNKVGCAIGCLVPVGQHKHEWERVNVLSLAQSGALLPWISKDIPIDHLRHLQALHDDSNTVEEFLAGVAIFLDKLPSVATLQLGCASLAEENIVIVDWPVATLQEIPHG